MRCITLNKTIEEISTDLTDKILGMLMKKRINEITLNLYKPKLYQLILDYLKSNY